MKNNRIGCIIAIAVQSFVFVQTVRKGGNREMADFDKETLTPEMLQKAMECADASELVALAKEKNIDLSEEEAEAFLEEMEDFELDEEALKAVAGGIKTCYMVDGCAFKCGTLKDC